MNLYVIDTSALISLGLSHTFDELSTRLNLQTTNVVVEELENMRRYEDDFPNSAEAALNKIEEAKEIKKHEIGYSEKQLHGGIDRGEASCIDLIRELEADFLVTDDHRASSALEDYVGKRVVFSPILLKALTVKGIIRETEAVEELRQIAERRNWFNSPLYEYGLKLFGED